ncbi:MAG: ankyrin repeat domain-containing protein, partial [Gemmatimonadales bacterium]
MCRPRWPHGRGRPEHHEPQWATALHTAAFLCRTEIVEALLDKGANKYLRDNFGNTAAEAVADPFDDVKDIYDSFKKALGPLGLELDYEQIRANRPQIAEILRPRTEELEAVEYAPLPGDDWNVSTPTEQGLDPMLVAELYLDATGLSTLYGLQRRFFLTSDVLIPIGLLLFIAFFVYAIVHSARKQREAKAGLFRDFASRHALRYQEEDDGKVLEFARDFDGIGRFRSPSLGKVIPKDVVHGKIEGKQVVLFRHSIHFSDSWAREWFVVGVTCKE